MPPIQATRVAANLKCSLWAQHPVDPALRLKGQVPGSALLPTFFGEGSPTKIDKPEKTRIPTYSNLSHLEDLEGICTSRLHRWLS